MDGRRSARSVSHDLLELEGGSFSPRNVTDVQALKEATLFGSTDGEPHDARAQPPPTAALAEADSGPIAGHGHGHGHGHGQNGAIDETTAYVLRHKHRSWARHLTLYTILGNIGMLLTVVSNNNEGVLSRVFCIGTYGHVFMEGSLLIRLMFPPSQNYRLQQLHNYWGMLTLVGLILYGNSHGELLWAAESILTDSMSLLLGLWLIQADVDPQVKLVGLSHFVHGVTFEFFLWFDIAALSASYTSTRGVFWVILVLANAVSQMVFHAPVIRGDVAGSDKPSTPSPQARRMLVCAWLCHNILSIPLVLAFSTLGGNHFYLEETRILPLYQVMIYTVPMTGLMYILYSFLRSKSAPLVSLAEENGIDNIGKPVAYEIEQHGTASLPLRSAAQARNDVEALSALGEVFGGVTGNLVHSAVQLLLGTACAVAAVLGASEDGGQDGGQQPFVPLYLVVPLSVPLVLAGLLGLGHGTGCIGQAAWNRVAGPTFFVATLVSMFSLSGTGLGYWSALGVLQQDATLPAFLVVVSSLYTAWSAWIMMHQAAHALRGCFSKGH
jgi:hypothetical protein